MGVPERLDQALKGLDELCGDWLSRSSARWRKSDWEHPMVSGYHFAAEVLKQGEKSILQSEHALNILFWERNISTVRDLIDLPRFRQRLRHARLCDKALYEIQVAALYRNSGYEIAFHDVGQQGYEFEVRKETGVAFVECKKKGETERDKQARSAWVKLGAAIQNSMIGMRRYAYVFLESMRDPVESDIPCVESLVRNLLGENFEGDVSQGDYWIRIEHIRPPDFAERAGFLGVSYPSTVSGGSSISNVTSQPPQRLPLGPQWPREPQHAIFQCEAKALGDSLFEARRIMAIGFRSLEERDYIKTVVNSFDEVRKRKQLPPCGPGIIYIEIGQPSGGVTVEQRFEEVAKAIFPKLQGESNRRVNAVVLTCTGKTALSTAINGKKTALQGVAVLTRVIQHGKPRTTLPARFDWPTSSVVTWGPLV